MTPEEFRLRFAQSRGLNLDSTPVPPAPIVPAPVQQVPIPAASAPPIRTDIIRSPGGPATDPTAPPHNLYPAGRPPLVPPMDPATTSLPAAAVPPPPPRVMPPMPAQAQPIPYAPPGVSLTSTPAETPAAGWAGTVGVPAPPIDEKPATKTDYNKILDSLDDVAKGLNPKTPQVQIPNLIAGAPESNQSNQMAAQLMAAMMNKNRGLTLTGR